MRDARGTEVRLHAGLMQRFETRPPASLAAAHGAAGDGEAPFRCITCHQGTGFTGRLAVKAVAARDAAVWLVGRGQEPRGMRVPLRDADCLGCHPAPERASPVGSLRRFHGRPEHAEARPDCMSCHPAHRKGRASEAFLDEVRVRSRCAECHSGMRNP